MYLEHTNVFTSVVIFLHFFFLFARCVKKAKTGERERKNISSELIFHIPLTRITEFRHMHKFPDEIYISQTIWNLIIIAYLFFYCFFLGLCVYASVLFTIHTENCVYFEKVLNLSTKKNTAFFKRKKLDTFMGYPLYQIKTWLLFRYAIMCRCLSFASIYKAYFISVEHI